MPWVRRSRLHDGVEYGGRGKEDDSRSVSWECTIVPPETLTGEILGYEMCASE